MIKLDYVLNKLRLKDVPLASQAQWIKVTKTYQDFSAAALTNDISIYTLPINGYIHDIKILPTTAFSGGAIATYSLGVGIVASLEKYCAKTDVFTGNTTLTAVRTPIVGMASTSATTDIRSQAISSVANLSAATAGSVSFYLLVSIVP